MARHLQIFKREVINLVPFIMSTFGIYVKPFYCSSQSCFPIALQEMQAKLGDFVTKENEYKNIHRWYLEKTREKKKVITEEISSQRKEKENPLHIGEGDRER